MTVEFVDVLLSVVVVEFLAASCAELTEVDVLVFCLAAEEGRSLLLISEDLTETSDAEPLERFSSLLTVDDAEVGISLSLYLVDKLLCLSRLPYTTELETSDMPG